MENVTVGFIGCGCMGGALATAMAKKINSKNIYLLANHFDHAKALADKINAVPCETYDDLIKNSNYIFLGVKPKDIPTAIKQLKNASRNTGVAINSQKIIISMAAGVSISSINSHLLASDTDVFRIMPNLPATCGQAMTAMCEDEGNLPENTETVKALLESAGVVEIVPEKLMDAVTAISGSGPAYGFMFIEALADAAVRFGMPRKQAYVYAAQTLKGAATMAMEDGRSISELKDAVCSPAGTTIEGVAALEKYGFRNAVIQGASAAYGKSVELAKK